MSEPLSILFLTQIVPYPPDAGPRIKTWNVLRYLHDAGHRIILATYARDDEFKHIPSLEDVCDEVYPIRIKRSHLADLFFYVKSVLSGRPFLIERDDLRSMRTLVNQIVEQNDIEIIHADQLSMVQFAYRKQGFQRIIPKPGKIIFDAHNAVWLIVDRMEKTAPWYLRPLFRREAKQVKAYEAKAVLASDLTLAVTAQDRQALASAVDGISRSADPSSIRVIPIAVDTTLNPVIERKPGKKDLLTLGTLHYPPNADGIRWFMTEVFPEILSQSPDTHLTIVGKNPPKDFYQHAQQFKGSVEITGYVDDLTPYYERSTLVVIPVRAGGGMRVRILEAFSKGMPVITTTVGLEGIEAINGRDVIVEDDPHQFAQAVLRLMNDTEGQFRLARCSRALVEEKYDWQKVLKYLDAEYRKDGRG